MRFFGAFPEQLCCGKRPIPQDKLQIQLRLYDRMVLKDNNNNPQEQYSSLLGRVRGQAVHHGCWVCMEITIANV